MTDRGQITIRTQCRLGYPTAALPLAFGRKYRAAPLPRMSKSPVAIKASVKVE